MFFAETAAARFPSIPLPNSGPNPDLYDLFLDTSAPVDEFGFHAHPPAFTSSPDSCLDTNSSPSTDEFAPVSAAADAQARTGSAVVAGVYAGDALFKNKVDFKADMPWQERARVKQILTGQASELSPQQQIGFLHAYGIHEQHELWAMYMDNLLSANH